MAEAPVTRQPSAISRPVSEGLLNEKVETPPTRRTSPMIPEPSN